MAFKPYEEIARPPIILTIAAKAYVLPPVKAQDGALIMRALSGDAESDVKLTDIALFQMALGPVYDELIADDVPFVVLSHAGLTALTDLQFGRDSAERFWAGDYNVFQAAVAASTDAEPVEGAKPAKVAKPKARKTEAA